MEDAVTADPKVTAFALLMLRAPNALAPPVIPVIDMLPDVPVVRLRFCALAVVPSIVELSVIFPPVTITPEAVVS
jgi:hypothetical protein